MILREKDLPEMEYAMLAKEVLSIGAEYQMPVILHTYVEVAARLKVDSLHLPVASLLSLSEEKKKDFRVLGASVHSAEEACAAYHAGATYLTAGHVFVTDCKKGVPPRGLDFLKEVCEAVPVPVYAIGGITEENAVSCVAAGAAGVCMMSGYMRF